MCILPKFDLVKGTVIDCLHAVFIGVTPHLLKLWLNKQNRGAQFYIGNKVSGNLNNPPILQTDTRGELNA